MGDESAAVPGGPRSQRARGGRGATPRARGRFVRARDAGVERFLDAAVLDYAAANGWIVVSHDVNTMPAAGWSRIDRRERLPGLLMVPQRAPVGTIIDDLIVIWSASDAAEWEGQVCFLPLA